MISLQIAFLLAGVIVFIVVAIISYDKLRSNQLHKRADARIEAGLENEDPDEILTSPTDTDNEPMPPQPTFRESGSSRPGDRENGEPRLKPEFLEQDAAPRRPAAEVKPETEPKMEEKETESWESRLKEVEELANTPIGGVPEIKDDSGDEGMQIEYVARVPGKNVIKRDSALGIYRQREFDLSKPHRIFGLSHPARMWCDLEKQPDSARFTDFGLTLQLADRNGPVDETELNRFSQLVLKLSEVFGRRFQFSCDLDEALKQAQHLDKLIKQYDALAILNIVARNESFRMSDIDEAARALGMVPNQRNVYVKYEGKLPAYRMADKEKTRDDDATPAAERTTRGVTLFMDIPRTPDPARVFNDMVSDAKEICKRLDGKLVDENHRGMTQKGLKRIGQEIRNMAVEMERDGIVPGRECAMKLF